MVAAAKETVNSAHELSLAEGLRFERRIFHALFALVRRGLGGKGMMGVGVWCMVSELTDWVGLPHDFPPKKTQNDQKEGMAAFVEKRKPKFTNT